MTDIILKGSLKLVGKLNLKGNSGTVKIGNDDALVVLSPDLSKTHGNAASPVIMPPPPASPLDVGLGVWVILSFNSTITANNKYIVAGGMVMQGMGQTPTPTWPGMVLPTQKNTGSVRANGIPINVAGDSAVIFPSGGTVSLNSSGQ